VQILLSVLRRRVACWCRKSKNRLIFLKLSTLLWGSLTMSQKLSLFWNRKVFPRNAFYLHVKESRKISQEIEFSEKDYRSTSHGNLENKICSLFLQCCEIFWNQNSGINTDFVQVRVERIFTDKWGGVVNLVVHPHELVLHFDCTQRFHQNKPQFIFIGHSPTLIVCWRGEILFTGISERWAALPISHWSVLFSVSHKVLSIVS